MKYRTVQLANKIISVHNGELETETFEDAYELACDVLELYQVELSSNALNITPKDSRPASPFSWHRRK
jgi:hypothetical protein